MERCGFRWVEGTRRSYDPHICGLPYGHEGDHVCGRSPTCSPVPFTFEPAKLPIQRCEVERKSDEYNNE